MFNMFYFCNSLSSLDLSSFDTSKVNNMYFMFYYCSSLRSLDLSSFDTYKVSEMSYMLDSLNSLESLNLSNFNSSQVTNVIEMLKTLLNRNKIYILDLTGFNFENIEENLFESFFGNSKFKFLNIKDIRSNDAFIREINKLSNQLSMFLCLNDASLIPKINPEITICCNYEKDSEKCDSSNYISLYYNDNVSYPSGFGNNTRNYISFLKYDNQMIKRYTSISIETDKKLDAKFAFPIENLDNFFEDDMMINSLVSLDFSNFDSSKITSVENSFTGLTSLKYI